MAVNLIGSDVKLMRSRYDEALVMQGIPVTYQYPLMAGTNVQGETLVDSFSDPIDTYIFFDGNPKIKTFKRYGWVVENDDNLPFLVHCSFNLPSMQRDCIFKISGQYSELPDRTFKVTEITYDMQAPDHLVAQVVPVYDNQVTGRTDKEVEQTFDSSSHFLQRRTDYRGQYHKTQEDGTGER